MTRIISRRSKLLAAIVTTFLLAGLLVVPVAAANPTIQVNDTSDVVDVNPGDGVCETATGNGVCTLRAAVMEANDLPGFDTIELQAATYTLTIPGPKGIEISDGGLAVVGQGAAATIIEASATPQGAFRRIFTTAFAPLNVTLGHMTLRHGLGEDGGGALLINDANQWVGIDHVVFADNHASAGGAIKNLGADLNLSHATFIGNSADNAGAIRSVSGALEVIDSVFHGNHATDNAGAIWVEGAGSTATITRTQVSANSAGYDAGAIHVGSSGSPDDAWATLLNSTLSGNSGDAAIWVEDASNLAHVVYSTIVGTTGSSLHGPSIGISGTILADASGQNCDPTTTSWGYNLVDDGSCQLVASDIQGDPLLGPLANNGGLTMTHAILAGSPAIDVIPFASCALDDQRGLARPIDGDGDGDAFCDIGAYEAPAGTYQLPDTPPTADTTITPDPTPMPDPTPTPDATLLPTPSGTVSGQSAPSTVIGGSHELPDTSLGAPSPPTPGSGLGLGLVMAAAMARVIAVERRRRCAHAA